MIGDIALPDKVQKAIDRLSRQLPLHGRQQALPAEYAAVHRAILRSLATGGRPPGRTAIAAMLSDGAVDEALARLGADDLIVLDAAGREVVGAYPMTTEDTPHHLEVSGVSVNAMCALDALAVAPMFDTSVRVASRCHVTAAPIRLRIEGPAIAAASPSSEIHVGIAWQNPCGHAAHSMCREMVFIADKAHALNWQAGDVEGKSLFTLAEALDFAGRFFRPLLT
jgi:hypothetical protein